MVQRGFQLWLKVAFDRIAGTLAFVTLLPLMMIVAALIRMTMGSPVLFRQVRPGFKEHPFIIYKFRTMKEAFGPDGRPLPDDERLTTIGRLVRAASLDELPQLWNVVRGDLSLVGPRPLLLRYLDRYTPEQRTRHRVRPGITGWAQVNGRNAIDWTEKFALDVWYVRNWSFWLDLKIIVITVAHLLRREGTTHPGHVSMPEFMGDDREAQHEESGL